MLLSIVARDVNVALINRVLIATSRLFCFTLSQMRRLKVLRATGGGGGVVYKNTSNFSFFRITKTRYKEEKLTVMNKKGRGK